MTLNQFEGVFMQYYQQCYMALAATRFPSNDSFVGKFES